MTAPGPGVHPGREGAVLPRPVEWFINRSNAGDIDSVLDVIAPGGTIRHDGHNLDWYALDEFLASSWYLGGYINLRQLGVEMLADEGWRVLMGVTGRSATLSGIEHPFTFTFRLREDKITSVHIEAARPPSDRH